MLNTWRPNTKQVNTASDVSVTGVLSATLEDTTAYFTDLVFMTVVLENTAANMASVHSPNARHVTDIVSSNADVTVADVQKLLDSITASGAAETFYNPTQELTLSGTATIHIVAAYVEELALVGGSEGTPEITLASAQWLRARSEAPVQTSLQRMFDASLAAVVSGTAKEAFAALVEDAATAGDLRALEYAIRVTDEAAADLLQTNVMLIDVEETLQADAGDSVQAVGHYTQNVKDLAGAWLVFKTSGEVVQGWVMNAEGDKPFSEYVGFEFNSMTKIGDTYFGASDEGLYRLEGDTDAGSQIDAHVTSMMLDFGTTAQKRVVAAYLGYTSNGTVVLKVRSVDQGKLVEHWYEAQEVVADAPRAGYKPLGRGLKSRYWQFELANVDGADFEIDKLDLQPIKLRRRV